MCCANLVQYRCLVRIPINELFLTIFLITFSNVYLTKENPWFGKHQSLLKVPVNVKSIINKLTDIPEPAARH